MSHTFTDENLLTWEAFASSGHFGLAIHPRIVFHCLSDPDLVPRYVVQPGVESSAEEHVIDYDETQLREMLRQSKELE